MVHRFSVGVSDEDNEHDNDDRGSRAIPTRTLVGARAAIGKDHAWVLEPLILFFGFLTIPEFSYRFTQSVAKFELMVLDVARVIYNKDDKDKKPVADNESVRLNEESLRRSKERRVQEQWQEMKLSDLNTNT